MNRLSYTKKFLVLGSITLIASAIVLYSLYSTLNKTITNTEHELQGISHIKAINLVIQLTQKHRALSAGVLSAQTMMQDDLQEIETSTNAAFAQLSKQLPPQVLTAQEYQQVVQNWGILLKQGMQKTVEQNFEMHTALIAHLLELNGVIADRYALVVDPYIDAYYLISTIIKAPIAMERLGRIRGAGVAMLASPSNTMTQKINIGGMVSELKGQLNVLANSLKKAALYNPNLSHKLNAIANNLNTSAQEIEQKVNLDILQEHRGVTPQHFFHSTTLLIDDVYAKVNDDLFPTIELILQNRVQHEQHTLQWMISIASLLSAIVLYFAIGGFYSVTNSLRSLRHSAREIASGNINKRVQLDAQDELAQVGESFNEIADGLSNLIKTQEEQALRFHSIIDTALDAVVEMSDQGVVTGWNKQAERVFGWSEQEAIGQPMHALIIPHQYREMHIKGLKHYMATGVGPVLNKRIEIVGLHRLGHEIPIELAISPNIIAGKQTFSAFIRDITDKKKAEESIQLSALVYQSSSEAMVVVDEDNKIISINPAFTEITGYSAEEVFGKNPSILKSGIHDQAFYAQMWDALTSTGKWQGEVWDKRKNGEIYPKWLTINTINDDKGTAYRRVALFYDITEKKRSEEMIWRQANFDELTGLPNRRMVYEKLEQEIKRIQRSNRLLALLFIDLDRFKDVNDSLGHEMGDLLLKEASNRMLSCVRGSDTVGRLGGDEFTILLSGIEDMDVVDRVTSKILDKMAQPFYLGSEMIYISASVGITLYPNDAQDAAQLLKNADQSMYEAKREGRNRYQYFTPAMQKAASARMRLINDLHTALDNAQLQVYYQPIVALATGNIHKAEALLRWQHPKHGMISPLEFIPIAEVTGLISSIGDWVFLQAASQVERCRRLYKPDFQISINKSPVQFKNGAQQHANWIRHLEMLGLPGQSISVEITESLLMEAKDEISTQLLAFRDNGMQVALDDFGTGYSSLSYLNKFDIDYLKIDKSFVSNLAEDSNDLVLCEAMIVMAHKLGIKVIAEGVETEMQARLLTNIGCDYGQGYLWYKPMSAADFEHALGMQPQVKQLNYA